MLFISIIMCLLCYLAALSVHAAHPERKAAMSYYSTILPFRVPIEMVGDYIRLYGAKLIYQRVPNRHSAISINPSNAKATFVQSTRTQRLLFENHINPVMLVFIG